MIDLKNTTFIIPIMIDTEDRRENIDLVVDYILHFFDTNIIIKELDITQKYYKDDKVKYVFEMNQDGAFHRTRLLNDMIMMADTEFIFNYDADVLLPADSYSKCIDMLNDGYDVIYPYINGMTGLLLVDRNNESFEEFKKSYDINILNGKIWEARYGFCFCMRKKTYIESFLENENFKSYGPEDWERSVRYEKLGMNIGRVDNKIYHIEHIRTEESNETNPHFDHNMKLFDVLKVMDKEQLVKYYQDQEYIKRWNQT